MASAITVDKILEAFPIQSIPRINGEPTYESVNNLARALKTNAASIATHLGGAQLGHLTLCVSPAVYATLSQTPFPPPQNPGPIFIAPAGTAPVIAAAERLFNERARQHALYHAVDRALKRQLIEAVDRTFIKARENRVTGFANATTLDLLTHLFFTYGRITPHDLEENDKRFKKQWDANMPFETLVEQIDDAVDYAQAGQSPYSPTQIVSNAYNLVYNTGLFPDACREWRRRPAAEHTWDNFKTDFSMAHTDLRNQRQTSQQSGYNQAAHNMMELFAAETADAFANLATAAAADKEIVKALTATNKELIGQLAAKEKEITRLRGLLDKKGKQGGGPPIAFSLKKKFDNENYCWTHGFDCHATHTSLTCKNPLQGHCREATRDNTMGGSQENKDKKF